MQRNASKSFQFSMGMSCTTPPCVFLCWSYAYFSMPTFYFHVACVIGILQFKLSFSGLTQLLADPVQEENSFIFVFHLARKQSLWYQKQAQGIIKDKKGEMNKKEYEKQKRRGDSAKEEKNSLSSLKSMMKPHLNIAFKVISGFKVLLLKVAYIKPFELMELRVSTKQERKSRWSEEAGFE